MGKTKNPRSHNADEDHKKTRKKSKLSQRSSSGDDDEEANEDLTLKIVEKALSKQKNADVLPTEGESDVKKKKKKKKKEEKKKKKKDKKEKRECVVVKEEEIAVPVDNSEEKSEIISPDSAAETDNIVLKKLLRGPRYFDPPGSSWGSCYNCGEEGHMAVNCNSARRKKPCFVCGSLDHSRKECPKVKDCHTCKKGGHRAKNCPEKNNASSKVCLKCGETGHDMFICRNDYSVDDLKEIQCYICKNLGHLCCAKVVDTSSGEISCYKCGQLGHTGLACNRLRAEYNGAAASPSSCYKCGEEGHIARECTSSVRSYSRFHEESSGAASLSSCYRCGEDGHFARECISSATAFSKIQNENFGVASSSSCYKCGEEGHFARECITSARVNKWNEVSTPTIKSHRNQSVIKSAPNDIGKSHKRNRGQYDESLTTPKKVKRRGGWIMDDPEDLNEWEYNNNWKSPSTPKSKGQKKSSFNAIGHWSSSKTYNYGGSGHGELSMAYQNNYSGRRSSSKTYNYGGSGHGQSSMAYQNNYSGHRYSSNPYNYGGSGHGHSSMANQNNYSGHRSSSKPYNYGGSGHGHSSMANQNNYSGHRSSSKPYNYGGSGHGQSSMANQTIYSPSRFSNSNGGWRNHDWW